MITRTNSVGKGWFIMSENITEKRHGTVLLVVELDMMEDFPQAEVIRAATFGQKVIYLCCSFHHPVANNSSWEHLLRNPTISAANMLLKDAFIVLSLRNMFLSIDKL